MVGPAQLSNAISINSSVFQLGGLIGPAISGVLISAVGPGYSFAINAASFAAPLAALLMMRPAELRRVEWHSDGGGQLRDDLRSALHWAVGEPHVLWPTVLAGVFGLFTANLAVTLAAYAHSVFHSGPSGYGLLSATVAAGSVAGALVCARLPRPRLRVLLAYGLVLAMLEIVSAAVPGQVAFAVLLVPIGACTLLLLTSTRRPPTTPCAAASWVSTYWSSSAAPPWAARCWASSTSMPGPGPACCWRGWCPPWPWC
jgi:hypothetical protein